MYASQLYIFVVAALVSTVAAGSLGEGAHHWSRHAHKANVARSPRPAPVPVSGAATGPAGKRGKRSSRRRTCKAPASGNNAGGTDSASVTATATESDSESATATSTDSDDDDDDSTTSKKSTKTSSTAKETSTGGSSSSGGSSGTPSGSGALSLDALFPVGYGSNSWTTSPKSDDALPLSDGTLNPFKVMSALSHTYEDAPDGKKAMRAHYPEGSFNPSHEPLGGISFYAPGADSLDMSTAKTLTFGYSVYFEDDFDFNKGGKLPGLYGGDSDEEAVSCSGGRRSTACYSARMMWRTNGAGEVYTYLPDYEVSGFSANKKVCNIAPFSECNPEYGASVGRGSFKFAKGKWTTVAQRVELNDAGQANGSIQLWVNGESVVKATGLKLRAGSAGRHRGIQMQTFFGGSDSSWASPKSQNAYFSDFSVAVIEKL